MIESNDTNVGELSKKFLASVANKQGKAIKITHSYLVFIREKIVCIGEIRGTVCGSSYDVHRPLQNMAHYKSRCKYRCTSCVTFLIQLLAKPRIIVIFGKSRARCRQIGPFSREIFASADDLARGDVRFCFICG